MLLLPSGAQAQAVYRCESGGKVAYSDAPCVGAQVIDATPTQGMDKSSGRSLKGQEVHRSERRRAFDDALRPLTRASHEEMNVLRHRHKLLPEDKLRCAALDMRLSRLEESVPLAVGKKRAEADVELYKTRKQFFDLKC